MRIIIVGAGIIGSNLAKFLTDENHEVYIIETDPETARKVDEKLDAKVIVGNGADPEALKKAGIEQADLVIAVTTSDETNLVVGVLAESFGAKRRIARVRSVSLSNVLDEVGYAKFHLDELINPEELASQTIIKTIETPGASEVADFAEGKILLRAFDIPEASHLCGLRVEEVRDEDFPWPFIIVAIKRNGSVLIPKGDTFVEAEDRIYVLLPHQSLGEFLTFVNPESRMPKKVVIYGATHMGQRVAKALSEKISDVILLEENPLIAEKAAGALESIRVINGTAAEKDILVECGIEAADAFIATSGNDHSNLVSAVLAKKMGAKRTAIITQHPDYMSIVDALKIDALINPRLLAMQQILRLVRGKGIQSVTKMMDCDAEALEFIPEPGAPITKSPIKNINFPKNSIVGAVSREDGVILVDGETEIKAGERVIVFCQESAVKKLQSLFIHKKAF
ncbi:MAG: Trk system potassium transporter TrkA [Candidatus Omnitrophica bacterium]|nr:Trk system potassium transporter TrkA [Candidatus Omnitrophota bacterium]